MKDLENYEDIFNSIGNVTTSYTLKLVLDILDKTPPSREKALEKYKLTLLELKKQSTKILTDNINNEIDDFEGKEEELKNVVDGLEKNFDDCIQAVMNSLEK